jgi:hypothetical protein
VTYKKVVALKAQWKLEQHLPGGHFDTDEDIQLEVHCWLSGLSPDFYCKSMNNPISRWDESLNRQDGYAEKWNKYMS